MKLGIIGANFGKYIASISPLLTIIYDPNIGGLKNNLKKVMSCKKIVVATPNHTHFQICRYLLEKKKDVLCLKPVVLSTNELEFLCTLAKDNNCLFSVGLNQRFRREFIALEDKKVHSINAVWEQANKEKVCFENFNNIKYDLGVHLIDLAIQLGLLTKDTKELIKYESYTNNDQSYTLLFKDRVSIRTRSTIFKGENLLHIRFLDEGGIALSEIKESGDVTTWKDSYTFTDMISSFINSNSKSNITEDILLLTKILCW